MTEYGAIYRETLLQKERDFVWKIVNDEYDAETAAIMITAVMKFVNELLKPERSGVAN